MRTRSKLALAGLAATLLMAFAVNSASAQRLSVSNNAFRVNWTQLTFGSPESETTLRCPVTLEGSFHSRTIQKSLNSLIGYVSRAAVSSTRCTGGSATILTATLPWHITYEGFTGTLPTITGVTVLLRTTAFQIEGSGTFTQCLYQENGTERPRGTINIVGGVANTLTPDTAFTVPFLRGSGLAPGLCPRRGNFETVGQVFLLNSNTTRITVTLI